MSPLGRRLFWDLGVPSQVLYLEIMGVFKEKSKRDKGKEMVSKGAQDTDIEIV